MENTKYQVFISSTYSDLAKERKQVLDVLLMADCIPAGMKNFAARDDEQFNVIKKVIDLCDYYILILGRSYGSVNDKTSISYTEMEYNYAMDKGIPVLVFALDDSIFIDSDKEESDNIKRQKLAEFKSRAMRNRLASVWKDQSDLMSKVAIAIMQAKNEIKRPGWHRGNDEGKESLKKEVTLLRKENDELVRRENMQDNSLLNFRELFYGKKIVLHYTEQVFVFTADTMIHEKNVDTTLDAIYRFVSLRITGTNKISDFENAISGFVQGYYVDTQDALVLRNKFEQLGLIKSVEDKIILK